MNKLLIVLSLLIFSINKINAQACTRISPRNYTVTPLSPMPGNFMYTDPNEVNFEPYRTLWAPLSYLVLPSTSNVTGLDAALATKYSSVNPAPTPTMVAGTGLNIANSGISFTMTNTMPDQTLVLNAAGSISVTGTYPNMTINAPVPVTYSGGSGITVSSGVITNTSPDQTVNITGTNGTSVSGTYPNYTVNSTPPVFYSSGDGISITSNSIINTSPDQVVNVSGSGISNVTGTYPNYTITSTEVDGSTSNEIQSLSINDHSVSISSGNTIVTPDNQALSISGDVISLTSGGSVTIPTHTTSYSGGTGISVTGSVITNTSPNVVQSLSISGNTVSLSNGGGTVAIPTTSTSYSGGTGISVSGTVITNTSPNINQSLSISGNTITLDNSGGSVVIPQGKRYESYSGTSNASGNYTVTFGTAYSAAPNVQPQLPNLSGTNVFCKVTSVSTTGFTISVYQRNAVTLLGIDVLLATTVATSGQAVDVLVVEK